MKRVIVLLFDGYSDWEISFLTPELQKNRDVTLQYVSIHGDSVTSMGGLLVKGLFPFSELNMETVSMLILPGGPIWESGVDEIILNLIRRVLDQGGRVAAICGATIGLAQIGLLNDINHTSNALAYLKQSVPCYNGDKLYQELLSVSSDRIITASGIAPIEFAKQIFQSLDIMDEEAREKWYQLFKYGVWQA
ncbi:DJ-1/PfpI family protein [Halosquirtibacter xylanolyticus]|uniref:DJ-1/PfpI family protein n=1 Tax=Halosquirtibacter xylanolyticus TaxID=3374599 RepID=UPI0037485AD5|nr:DJ-1/PfpI family protein [Prolixibacteraceae bacterium]